MVVALRSDSIKRRALKERGLLMKENGGERREAAKFSNEEATGRGREEEMINLISLLLADLGLGFFLLHEINAINCIATIQLLSPSIVHQLHKS